MAATELFRSANLLVRHVPAADPARLVVTFDNLQSETSLDRAGFGEAWLAALGIGAIHVIGAGNDWYQYPEMAEALAAIARVTAGAPHVLAYGSSMGGYAAIRHGGAIGASAVLALSPQYAIDPAQRPFERRWTEHATRIRWLAEAVRPIACPVAPVIAFDPVGADGAHVALIAADVPIVPLPLPRVGHPATTFLANTGLLGPLMIDVLDGTLDPTALLAEARVRRRRSSAYFVLLAEEMVLRRPRMAVALADSALALEPELVTALVVRGRALSFVGRHDEAIAVLDRAVALSGGLLEVEIVWLEVLAGAGEIRRSLAETDRLIAAAPARGHLPGWKAHLHWMLGEEDEAFAAIDRARAIDPLSEHHAVSLAYYQAERAKRDAKWRWYGGGRARRRWQPTVRRLKRWWRGEATDRP